MTVDGQNLAEIKTKLNWKKFLRRIVDVILTLATNDIRENRLLDDPGVSKGDYLEIVHLLSWYDRFVKFIETFKTSVKYLCPAVQNKLFQDEILIKLKM